MATEGIMLRQTNVIPDQTDHVVSGRCHVCSAHHILLEGESLRTAGADVSPRCEAAAGPKATHADPFTRVTILGQVVQTQCQ